ncbi:MAG: hypothetical protein COW44_10585 [Flavobacteriaceae bacterium CG17_big_fil_post_rev_8_21_14_2_50_33_15]|nr:MAG: hypothetical protein COW44_10585 [Flavobacteriaceae bacterium CG17_big_fil_post_rev_8_21_14_2_50_33_15]
MKKSRIIILILVFILGTKINVAQSKSETENWLISIIEDPEYKYNAYHLYDISFENGNMIIVSPLLQELYEYKIPLNSLGKIKLQKLDDGYRLTISCSNEACIKFGEYVNRDTNNYQFASYNKQTIIMFGTNLEFDDLPSRLNKALKHLVQLNGGKLIEEPF